LSASFTSFACSKHHYQCTAYQPASPAQNTIFSVQLVSQLHQLCLLKTLISVYSLSASFTRFTCSKHHYQSTACQPASLGLPAQNTTIGVQLVSQLPQLCLLTTQLSVYSLSASFTIFACSKHQYQCTSCQQASPALPAHNTSISVQLVSQLNQLNLLTTRVFTK